MSGAAAHEEAITAQRCTPTPPGSSAARTWGAAEDAEAAEETSGCTAAIADSVLGLHGKWPSDGHVERLRRFHTLVRSSVTGSWVCPNLSCSGGAWRPTCGEVPSLVYEVPSLV